MLRHSNFRFLWLTPILAALFASTAFADIVGSTYHFSVSATHLTQIAATAGTYTDPANPGFCVDSAAPPACATAGMSGSFAFSDVNPTLSTITFTFFGSTGTAPGSFSIDLSNFVLPDGDSISNVTYASGNLLGRQGVFDTVTWNGTDAVFGGGTPTSYDAIGGASVVFDVTEVASTPEPSSILLLGSGALTLLGMIRRKMRA